SYIKGLLWVWELQVDVTMDGQGMEYATNDLYPKNSYIVSSLYVPAIAFAVYRPSPRSPPSLTLVAHGDADGNHPTPMAPSTEIDPENASTSAAPSATNPAAVALALLAWWRGKGLLERSAVVLRPLALVFSLLAFIVCASNRHGDWKNFERYEEYRYLLAISILAFLYSVFQVSKPAYRFSTGIDLVPKNYSGIVDFAGDQVTAYLLISALSAAIPVTNSMRGGADNIFTDASCASIILAFFAFVSIALSALISGFKLSKQI
ncbi:unnamed protein product, partial [Musa hybrid cultivar]